MRQRLSVLVASYAAGVVCAGSAELTGADVWVETKSAYFQVVSNASEGCTRTLTWQLEQIRSVIATLWPWVKEALGRRREAFSETTPNSC